MGGEESRGSSGTRVTSAASEIWPSSDTNQSYWSAALNLCTVHAVTGVGMGFPGEDQMVGIDAMTVITW